MRLARLAFAIVSILGISLPARAESASNLYLLNCWGCHGSHGEGIKGTAPPLAGLGDFLKADGGRSYIIEVPGVSMSSLSDEQVAVVMNWLLQDMGRDHLPGGFQPYTAQEVHRYRAIRLANLSQTRKAILKQLVTMKIRSSSE